MTDFGNEDQARSLAIASDQKIVEAGNTGTTAADFALARYNTDGTLDTSAVPGASNYRLYREISTDLPDFRVCI